MSDRTFDFLREQNLAAVLASLNGAGEETRVVGGAVRSVLLGLQPADIDLATTALPEIVAARAQAAGWRVVPTGIAHGTLTLVVAGTAFEVTTLREDIETDGRHAKVRFGRDFVADALRRDFTMNALSLTADGRLFDYVGGARDIAARRVRFIGDAARRIAEDYLRSLRFFRFHGSYGAGAPDAEGLAAVISARHGLAGLSRERVRSEMLKLLASQGAAEMARIMSDAGLLGLLLHGATAPARLARLMHAEAERKSRPDAVLRLAALAVWTREDAQRLSGRLRLANHEHDRLAAAADIAAVLRGKPLPPDGQGLRALLFAQDREAASDGMALAQIDDAAMWCNPLWTAAFADLARLSRPKLPFSGTDLQNRGISGGPLMGQMLKTLQAQWIRAGFPKDPLALARLLDAVVAASHRP